MLGTLEDLTHWNVRHAKMSKMFSMREIFCAPLTRTRMFFTLGMTSSRKTYAFGTPLTYGEKTLIF